MRARKILVFQTAFIGDVILTLPLIQVLHRSGARVDVVAIPSTAELLPNHPAINAVIVYDKRSKDRGVTGGLSLARCLRRELYDAALIPHRSLRSGLICYLAGIPKRYSFSTSAASILMTGVVKYDKSAHEISRNLSLLNALEIPVPAKELPSLFPAREDVEVIDKFFGANLTNVDNMIALAPGSVWATKRWLPERFAELASSLVADGFAVILVGGNSDRELGDEITSMAAKGNTINSIGKFSLLQSAELIRRCKILVTNDSAPLHIGVAMRTPVVAVFGATIPEFGFSPVGEHDEVVQTLGLDCRPCSVHGGDKCPIGTFVCMKNISIEHVREKIQAILSKVNVGVAS